MSEGDKPSGPPGRGDRTIIRPNPGARRPAAPSAPSPPPASSAPGVSYPAQAAPGAPASTEDWISTQAAPKQTEEVRRGPDLRLDELAAPNENPIMRAAGPLLLLLGRLRVALLKASFAHLMEQVADAVVFFEKEIRSAGIPERQANTAKYILCATADDIVQNIPTEDRHVWTQYSMLSRFFGERIGGVRFFEELEKALKDPLVNYPLLELQHTCLALGFQGVHRSAPNGPSSLQQIQRNPLRHAAADPAEDRPRPVAALAGTKPRRPRVAAARADLGRRIGHRRVAARALRDLAGAAQRRIRRARLARSRRCTRPTGSISRAG
jgi:type VI secretion system protein ImpK